MEYISINYIIKLHEKLIAYTSGSDGLRDGKLLELAIENSKYTFDGVDLYPTIEVLLGNITKQKLDVIVNSANQSLLAGSGISGAIHKEAGPELENNVGIIGQHQKDNQ